RTDDVLALRPDAFLLHRSKSGTGRMSGGAFEQTSFVLRTFDADGRIARTEFFDDDCADQALARFDVLTTAPASSPAASPRRRAVRPNAATANAAAIDAVIAAREPQARAQLTPLHRDEYEVVDHINGITHDLSGSLAGWDALMRVPDLTFRLVPLATLGDSLALFRRTISASGGGGGDFDLGIFEVGAVVLSGGRGAGRPER